MGVSDVARIHSSVSVYGCVCVLDPRHITFANDCKHLL